ncbi:App1 family protein [Aequorivita capsosiphonis]|uniref:App1 family protein n=1 Tax=Aequorivita capsosiphonis TaxID=487317 RepID=UPI00041207E4|nr:phosphatase domain-containing protein [Aequorivita capsosiphonis]
MSIFKKDPIQIITFRSYGTQNHLYAKGRALEDENIDLSKKGFFNLLWNTYKRFETDLITDAQLILTLPDGRKIETETDSQGYFLIDQAIENILPLIDKNGCLQYEISFAETFPKRKIQSENRFKGEVFIPSETAKFGVISDVDDTIMHTGLTSRFKWKVIKNTIFKRAEKRVPLEGAADFYQMLKKGKSADESNPIFYVSHGPWNLYRYLEVFLETNNFPKGPILLRDFVNPFAKKYKPEKPQKQKEIINILKTYPQLNFILIGDSGEHDPDIYTEIAEAHPERILAIYLRNVKHKKKMIRVKGLFKDYETVPVLLVEDSEAAIMHAKEMGFI